MPNSSFPACLIRAEADLCKTVGKLSGTSFYNNNRRLYRGQIASAFKPIVLFAFDMGDCMIKSVVHFSFAVVLGFCIALQPSDITQGDSSYHSWIKHIHATVDRHKKWPDGASKEQISAVVVVVSFSLDRNGNVKSIDIEKSSGLDLFDREAVDTVKRAAPFDRIPWYIQEDIKRFSVPIRFRPTVEYGQRHDAPIKQ